MQISGKDVQGWLKDLPAERLACANLAALALAKAVENYCSFSNFKLRKNKNRVLVGLSGGVDSSTTAYLLEDQGYEVIGATAKVFDCKDQDSKSCCRPKDIEDARLVCKQLNIPHIVLDLRQQFKKEVIDRFCQQYLEGKTPNPCIDCNRFFRFKHLRQFAFKLGSAKIATGHYVRLLKNGQKVAVYRAVDKSKDQSYLFWAANQDILQDYLTPLGELTKKEVRLLAANLKLPVATKQDSQDICFIPEGNYRRFLQQYLGLKPKRGLIVDAQGNVLGQHQGFYNYTVGQRKGLNLSLAAPLYVLRLEPKQNLVVVGRKEELWQRRFKITNFNFIDGSLPSEFKAEVMLRYNAPLVAAKVKLLTATEAIVEFAQPTGPVSPGQSAVFYDSELVLGGGLICSGENN
jgi:tRNA-specific 2-thiouridylase